MLEQTPCDQKAKHHREPSQRMNKKSHHSDSILKLYFGRSSSIPWLSIFVWLSHSHVSRIAITLPPRSVLLVRWSAVLPLESSVVDD
eukprot:1925936-Amphidinium_carterae.1